MSETFYTILTTVGQAKIANAQVTGQNVNLTEIAVGDGGGSYYNPVQTQTSLKNEVWRGNIGSVQVDEENPNWIVIEGVIPATVGGFFVREVGIFDDAGDMIAIGKYPETYKPVTTEGSAKDLYIRMIIEVTNASAVQLKIDPSVIIASRKYVDDKVAPVEQKANQNATSILQLQQQVNAHLNDKLQDGVHGLATTQDMTLYVDGTNGDDSNDGQTPQTAFRTIQKAIDSLPKYIAHSVVINVAPGDYSNEDVKIRGFIGSGTIQLLGDTVVPDTRVVDRIFPSYSTVPIYVRGFRCLGIGKAGVQVGNCVSVTIEYLKIDNQDGEAGVYVNVGKAFVRNSTISNRGTAIYARSLSEISSINNTGTNNSVALRAVASVIRKEGTQPGGTTNESTLNGGLILGRSAAAIVDMGSNANGTYVRWSNGLQICWAGRSVINWPAQTTTNQGSYYNSDFIWTFPASFIDTNVIITASPGFVGTGGAWGLTTIYPQSVTTTSVILRLWTTHSRPEPSNGTAVAFGRWK